MITIKILMVLLKRGDFLIKEERLSYILDKLKKQKFVRVSDITKELDVTDMTVRRDLQKLEEQNLAIRVHGGAKLVEKDNQPELSHIDKIKINIEDKKEIAKKIAGEIHDNETIFLGAGTTIELVHEFLDADNIKIITNSLHLFNRLKHDDRFDLILIGGTYRDITGCFVGTIANDLIKNIHVEKSFIGVNALTEEGIYTYSENEGIIQQRILNNSAKKYIVADVSKFDRKDFYRFYTLEQADTLITNDHLDSSIKDDYKKVINII